MKLFKIDHYWELTFNTQALTGAATDADALPTYRVYECSLDGTPNDTVLQTGNAAKRDDANTTGYYAVRDQATAAAGYEVGKTYEVRVAATVGGVAGAAVVGRFGVMAALVWDSFFGADRLQVDVEEIGPDIITAASIAAGAITATEAPTLANLDAAVSSVRPTEY